MLARAWRFKSSHPHQIFQRFRSRAHRGGFSSFGLLTVVGGMSQPFHEARTVPAQSCPSGKGACRENPGKRPRFDELLCVSCAMPEPGEQKHDRASKYISHEAGQLIQYVAMRLPSVSFPLDFCTSFTSRLCSCGVLDGDGTNPTT